VRAILRFTLAESCPDPAEVLRSRDLPDAPDLPVRARGALEEALARFADLSEPRAVFEEIPATVFASVLGDVDADRSVVAHVFPRADALALFAATVGEPVCLEIRRLFARGDIVLGYMLDTVASVAADRLSDLTTVRFRDALGPRNSRRTRILPYSPGYCGWPTTGQGALFEQLQPGEIGITLNDSCLMWPLKSISGVLVAGPLAAHTFETDFPFCDACATRECRARLATAAAGDELWTS